MKRSAVFLTLVLLFFLAFLTSCASTYPLQAVSDAYNDRGMIRLILDEDYRGAIGDFTRAIELNPNDADLYVGRGLAYLKLGYSTEAKNDFNRAVSLNSNLNKALRPLIEE